MANEKLILIFKTTLGEEYRHTWIVKKGIRGARNAKKILRLQKRYGNPIEIIGEGSVANLMRKELKIYNKDPEKYGGVSTKDILSMGSDISGLPVKKLQKLSSKIMRKIQNKPERNSSE